MVVESPVAHFVLHDEVCQADNLEDLYLDETKHLKKKSSATTLLKYRHTLNIRLKVCEGLNLSRSWYS